MMMRIISGRGRNRKTVVDFPHADIVNASPKEQQTAALAFLCNALGVPQEKENAVTA
jgi:hypothetical protein